MSSFRNTRVLNTVRALFGATAMFMISDSSSSSGASAGGQNQNDDDQFAPLEGPSLLREDNGAMMVIGVFMAVFVVGMLYYITGIGETIVYRERMLDAADAGSFAGAVMYARGMNVVALLNMIMAIVIAVLVALKVVYAIIVGAEIIAVSICAGCGPWCGPCCAACPFISPLDSARRAVDSVIDVVEPIVEAIVEIASGIQEGVKYAYPLAAQAKVISIGFTQYNEPTTAGFMYPIIPKLPIEVDDSDLLCDKAGQEAGALAVAPIAATPAGRFMSTATGALARTFSSYFCGDTEESAKRIEEDAELGEEPFQIRGIMIGDPPFDRNEARVALASWGRDEGRGLGFDVFRLIDHVSFSQAEFYYSDGSEDREEWMWHMLWRARFRRFYSPIGGDFAGVCGPCGDIARIIGVGDAVIH